MTSVTYLVLRLQGWRSVKNRSGRVLSSMFRIKASKRQENAYESVNQMASTWPQAQFRKDIGRR